MYKLLSVEKEMTWRYINEKIVSRAAEAPKLSLKDFINKKNHINIIFCIILIKII